MNHGCKYVLLAGKRKGEECRKIALYFFDGSHYCKSHCVKAKVNKAVKEQGEAQ